MFKKLTLGALGVVSAQQMLVVNQQQLQALLDLQNQLNNQAPVITQPEAPTGQPTEPQLPVAPQKALSVMEMYKKSLSWADDVVKHSASLDKLIRTADNFVSLNTKFFAEYGDDTLAKAFQTMSQVVVDTKNTLRDVQAYARQIKDRLSDANEYLSMIQIAEGAAPTSDDMEILDMVLDAVKSALAYSGETTNKVRADFAKINQDLVAFGDHLKLMLATVTNNMNKPQEEMLRQINYNSAQIALLTKDDASCGTKGVGRLLGKKSKCKSLEEESTRLRQKVKFIEEDQKSFIQSASMLQQMGGLNEFMADPGNQYFQAQIAQFNEQFKGQSILHLLPEPEILTVQLSGLVEKATTLEKESEQTAEALNQMFKNTVGRHRFSRQLMQNLHSFVQPVHRR